MKEISLAECQFTSATLTTFVQSVRWDTAALNSLTVDSTGNMKSQKTYTLTAGEDQIQLSEKNLGSADVALIAAWLQRPEVSAAMNSLTLDMNGIFGELYSSGNVKEADKFADECDPFLAALKISNIATLSLRSTGIGPVALQKLATSLPAALNLLTLSSIGG